MCARAHPPRSALVETRAARSYRTNMLGVCKFPTTELRTATVFVFIQIRVYTRVRIRELFKVAVLRTCELCGPVTCAIRLRTPWFPSRRGVRRQENFGSLRGYRIEDEDDGNPSAREVLGAHTHTKKKKFAADASWNFPATQDYGTQSIHSRLNIRNVSALKHTRL